MNGSNEDPPEGYTAEEWAGMVACSNSLELGALAPAPRQKPKLFSAPIPDVAERMWTPPVAIPGLRPKRVANRTYVVRCEGFVKIGMASDVETRFRALLAMNPLPLVMLKVLPGGREIERALHLRFAEYRHRDEWFRVEGALEAWIEEGCPL